MKLQIKPIQTQVLEFAYSLDQFLVLHAFDTFMLVAIGPLLSERIKTLQVQNTNECSCCGKYLETSLTFYNLAALYSQNEIFRSLLQYFCQLSDQNLQPFLLKSIMYKLSWTLFKITMSDLLVQYTERIRVFHKKTHLNEIITLKFTTNFNQQ